MALGSRIPDIDTPFSTIGRLVPVMSGPLYFRIGHRSATHSDVAMFACIAFAGVVVALLIPGLGLAFFAGYVTPVAADLLTREGGARRYPLRTTRISFWPRVTTGGLLEPVIALALSASCAALPTRLIRTIST